MTLKEAQLLAVSDTSPTHDQITNGFIQTELRRQSPSYRPRHGPESGVYDRFPTADEWADHYQNPMGWGWCGID